MSKNRRHQKHHSHTRLFQEVGIWGADVFIANKARNHVKLVGTTWRPYMLGNTWHNIAITPATKREIKLMIYWLEKQKWSLNV